MLKLLVIGPSSVFPWHLTYEPCVLTKYIITDNVRLYWYLALYYLYVYAHLYLYFDILNKVILKKKIKTTSTTQYSDIYWTYNKKTCNIFKYRILYILTSLLYSIMTHYFWYLILVWQEKVIRGRKSNSHKYFSVRS